MNNFNLLETLLWTKEEGFFLLSRHMARLRASALTLGFVCDGQQVEAALNAHVTGNEAERLRVRLTLDRAGHTHITSAPLPAPDQPLVWRVGLAQARILSTNAFHRHKTTERAFYEDALEKGIKTHQADEVLFLNEKDEVCETARGNVFIHKGENDPLLLTPHSACGLLPGTLRQDLLDKSLAQEANLTLKDIRSADHWFVGNSVRGLVRAIWIE